MAREAISGRLRAAHQQEASLLELQTKYLVSAFHGAMGSKAGGKVAAGISFLPKKKRTAKVISTEYALAKFGAPLIPMEE